MSDKVIQTTPNDVIERADQLRLRLGERFRDQLVETLYKDAQRITRRSVRNDEHASRTIDGKIDRLVTSPVFGLPIMLVLLVIVFWITVTGANIPSAFIAGVLMEEGGLSGWLEQYLGIANAPAFASVSLYELLHRGFAAAYAPWWLSGFLIDGVYLGLAWVVSVMLPPMAIFFPIWTILEDLGYLPRIAFNLDGLFKKSGAHGKQALTMAMGFGCNAAAITSCRIIDSPRERIIAILTNNFMICNGRFPTLIMLASIFVAAAFPKYLVSFVAAGAVIAIVLLGVLFTFLTSWALSRTLLKGEPSAFTLELPPYRRPNIPRILYTSLIDRTIFVLVRAITVSAPAGGIIWLLSNIAVADHSLAHHIASFLDPLGHMMGLDGIILLAFVIAIPANEIVVPTLMMVYMGLGRMTELESFDTIRHLLVDQHGWTLLTAVCLMLFVLLHNPCGTTIWTIWRETRSRKWTVVAILLPLAMGFLVCALVANTARFLT